MIRTQTTLKVVPSLKRLDSLALKYIFDKFHMTAQEERDLDEGIRNWIRKVNILSFEKKELQVILNALIRDKKGGYEQEKYIYKKVDIDYREVYTAGL